MDLDKKNIIIDKIIDFNNFEREIIKITHELGISIKSLPHIKNSKKNSYQDYYNSKSKDKVYKYFKKTINLMNYEF